MTPFVAVLFVFLMELSDRILICADSGCPLLSLLEMLFRRLANQPNVPPQPLTSRRRIFVCHSHGDVFFTQNSSVGGFSLFLKYQCSFLLIFSSCLLSNILSAFLFPSQPLSSTTQNLANAKIIMAFLLNGPF